MLVLSRKRNQIVVIGEGENRVVVTVALIEHNMVRLGFDAPRDVKIMRGELLTKDELKHDLGGES